MTAAVALPPLLIVGAGGFGRETAEAVRARNDVTPAWDLIGFVDDSPQIQGVVIDGVKVVGPVDAIGDHPNAAVVVSIGNPENFAARRRIVARIGLDSQRYATVVHPGAILPPSVVVGPGSVLLAGVVATTGLNIGAHVVVMPSVVFTHDDVVEDYTTFGAGAALAGAVHVSTGAYIGAGALIREKRTIGPWALIGMGAAVTSDVPAGEVWAGTPARYLRRVVLTDDLRAEFGIPASEQT